VTSANVDIVNMLPYVVALDVSEDRAKARSWARVEPVRERVRKQLEEIVLKFVKNGIPPVFKVSERQRWMTDEEFELTKANSIWIQERLYGGSLLESEVFTAIHGNDKFLSKLSIKLSPEVRRMMRKLYAVCWKDMKLMGFQQKGSELVKFALIVVSLAYSEGNLSSEAAFWIARRIRKARESATLDRLSKVDLSLDLFEKERNTFNVPGSFMPPDIAVRIGSIKLPSGLAVQFRNKALEMKISKSALFQLMVLYALSSSNFEASCKAMMEREGIKLREDTTVARMPRGTAGTKPRIHKRG